MSRPVLLLLALSACTWVSQDDLDARLGQLDDDGDGFTRDGGGNPGRQDCDDTDPAIHPGADELWYDGVDSDCDGANDFDQDGDGYVIADCTDPVWCGASVPSGDCDDTDPAVYPTALDDFYDGVDSNCDGVNDFDLDGDGYVAEDCTDPVYCGADQPGGDCDDLNAGIHPGATEIWYDGTDQDCDDGDDFDQDGDTFPGDDNPDTEDVDCDDLDPDIYPSATDPWYDGVDSNCDGANDHDQDGDGYVNEGCTDPVYCGAEQPGDDCDDGDALVYPYGEEVFDDLVDGDCDGDPDQVSLYTLDVSFLGAQSLRALDYESQVIFSVVADELRAGSGATVYDSAGWVSTSFFPPFVISSLDRWEYDDVVPWLANNTSDLGTLSMSEGQEILIDKVDGRDFFCGATGLLGTSSRSLRLSCYQVADSGGGGKGDRVEASDSRSTTAEFSDITLARDSEGNFHAFGCSETGGLQVLISSDQDIVLDLVTTSAHYTTINATACRVHFYDASGEGRLAYVDADTLEYVELGFDPLLNAEGLDSDPALVFTELIRTSAPAPRAIDWPQDASSLTMALLNTSGNLAVYVGGVTGSKWAVTYHEATVVDAHIDASPAGDWYLGWAEVTGEGGVAWGDASAGFTGSGRVKADFSFDEIYPIYAEGTGYLYLVAISGSKMAVGAVLAPTP